MTRRALLWALVLLALGGLMLHYRVHPFMVTDKLNPGVTVFNRTNFLASLFPMLDVFVVTALFMSRSTAIYGYLLNGFLVIFGTIFMTHFSLAVLMLNPAIPSQWFTNSLLPDIGIAWADFFVGKALYESYLSGK
jgi:hypothetical protein